jgi:hypothetical protein
MIRHERKLHAINQARKAVAHELLQNFEQRLTIFEADLDRLLKDRERQGWGTVRESRLRPKYERGGAPQVRTISPPQHRAEPPQPKSIWQAIKDTTGPGHR